MEDMSISEKELKLLMNFVKDGLKEARERTELATVLFPDP